MNWKDLLYVHSYSLLSGVDQSFELLGHIELYLIGQQITISKKTDMRIALALMLRIDGTQAAKKLIGFTVKKTNVFIIVYNRICTFRYLFRTSFF